MNILVVEDDKNKMTRLSDFIAELFPGSVCQQFQSYSTGLRAIVQGAPDLILLDMTMPTFDVTSEEEGGRTRAYAGRIILREMHRRRVRVPTIVVTQFEKFFDGGVEISIDQLRAELRREFGPEYLGLVYYHPAQSEWKDAIKLMAHGMHTRRGA